MEWKEEGDNSSSHSSMDVVTKRMTVKWHAPAILTKNYSTTHVHVHKNCGYVRVQITIHSLYSVCMYAQQGTLHWPQWMHMAIAGHYHYHDVLPRTRGGACT